MYYTWDNLSAKDSAQQEVQLSYIQDKALYSGK